MEGISIRYRYDGDEADWREAVDGFIAAVNADPDISGKFSYAVSVAADGVTRLHVGRWDTDTTLETLQSRDYFKAFSQSVKGFAGDSLEPVRTSLYRETR